MKGLIAGAAGAALLLTGGTWALWWDSEQVTDQLVIGGNLDLAVAGEALVYDTSTNRYSQLPELGGIYEVNNPDYLPPGPRGDADVTLGDVYPCLPSTGIGATKGHVAQPGDQATNRWHPVPGDSITAVYPFALALQGDNMVATLYVDGYGSSGGLFNSDAVSNAKMTVYYLGDTGPEEIGSLTKYEMESLYQQSAPRGPLLGCFQAQNEDNGQLDQSCPIVPNTSIPANPTTADANVCAVIEVDFDPGLTQRQEVQTSWVGLANLKFILLQSRMPGLGLF
jgi:predicted ribosomally synthesized peptide with SipW-like signal peptide